MAQQRGESSQVAWTRVDSEVATYDCRQSLSYVINIIHCLFGLPLLTLLVTQALIIHKNTKHTTTTIIDPGQRQLFQGSVRAKRQLHLRQPPAPTSTPAPGQQSPRATSALHLTKHFIPTYHRPPPLYNRIDSLHTTTLPPHITSPPIMTLAEEFRSRNFSKKLTLRAIGG